MRSRFGMAALVSSLLFPGCEPPARTLDFEREEVPVFRKAPDSAYLTAEDQIADPQKPQLKVMTWNVKYAGGRIDFWFDFWGDRVQMSLEEVEKNMDGIYRLIRAYDPDILLTQEIEVNSRRTAYFDMVQGILDHTHLKYGAYFQTWDSRYVPSEGLGRIDLGNAVFSKFPITSAESIRQEDRTDQDPLTRTFYIHRVVGRAGVRVGERDLAVYVVHTEPWDHDGTKQKQIQQIYDLVKAETQPFLLGGDFNELPPTAAKTADFLDEPEGAQGTEYEQPPYTPEVLQKFYDDFRSAITLEMIGATEASQSRFYTHSVIGAEHGGTWNRTLDYLFVRRSDEWKRDSTDVLQFLGSPRLQTDPELDPLALSDHAPVVGIWKVGD